MRTTNITKRENVLKLRMLQLYRRMLYALLFRAAAASIFRLFKRKTIKMKATSSSETPVNSYQTTQSHIPEDSNRIFHLGNPFVFVYITR